MPLLAHLTDPHLGAAWGTGDPTARLTDAVAALAALPAPFDAVLVTGDLADNGTPGEYQQAAEALSPLGAPILVAAGNHDDRAALRAAFGLPGSGADPVRYVAEVGPAAVVVLDTTIPGEDAGHLDGDALAWLEDALAATRGTPVVLALHHPPLLTGSPFEDPYALSDEGRDGLAAVVGRHAHVSGIVAGHLHRTVLATCAGVPLVVLSSTYVQARFDPAAVDVPFLARPPAAALHAVRDGSFVTHVEQL